MCQALSCVSCIQCNLLFLLRAFCFLPITQIRKQRLRGYNLKVRQIERGRAGIQLSHLPCGHLPVQTGSTLGAETNVGVLTSRLSFHHSELKLTH